LPSLKSALIAELKKRGHRVAAVKHSAHRVSVDQEGKDSHRMHEAGASVVGLMSESTVSVYLDTDSAWTLEDLVGKLMPPVDVVLVEGYGDAPIPRFGVVRSDVTKELKTEKGVFAVVSDFDFETDKPLLGFDDVEKMADLVEGYIKKMGDKRDVRLFVNGEKVQIKPFIKDFFLKTIAAMVDSLKGTGGADRIKIVIDKPGGDSPE